MVNVRHVYTKAPVSEERLVSALRTIQRYLTRSIEGDCTDAGLHDAFSLALIYVGCDHEAAHNFADQVLNVLGGEHD
jgi:hypothetical protein